MSHHPTSEALSAFLDGEAAAAEARGVTAHLGSCPSCRSRLDSLRQVVDGLRFLPTAPPPADLGALVRSRIAARTAPAAAAPRVTEVETAEAAEAPGTGGGFRGAWGGPAWAAVLDIRRRLGAMLRGWRFGGLRWDGLPPLRGAFGSFLGVGLALLAVVLALERGADGGLAGYPGGPLGPPGPGRAGWQGGPEGAVGSGSRVPPAFLVSASFGDTAAALTQTTSQVAGREFVLSGDAWIQRGLDLDEAILPAARVGAHSPQGRALLARYADLGVLLADGSRVVLRDHRETLEIWNGS